MRLAAMLINPAIAYRAKVARTSSGDRERDPDDSSNSGDRNPDEPVM